MSICPLEYLNKSSAELGDLLATIDVDRKSGAVPLLRGAGSPCNTVWFGRDLASYQVAS